MALDMGGVFSLDTVLNGLGVAGRGIAATAFRNAANNSEKVDQVAGAMYDDEFGRGKWAALAAEKRQTWRARAQAAMHSMADIVSGK